MKVEVTEHFVRPPSAEKADDVGINVRAESTMQNLLNLGYDKASEDTSGCEIWLNETASEIHSDLLAYRTILEKYNKAVAHFEEIPDVMESIQKDGDHRVCETARIRPDGMNAFFVPKEQLSHGHNGYMEPLYPPMRHHEYCWDNGLENLLRKDYIIHD